VKTLQISLFIAAKKKLLKSSEPDLHNQNVKREKMVRKLLEKGQF